MMGLFVPDTPDTTTAVYIFRLATLRDMGGSKAFKSKAWVFFNPDICLEKGTIASLGTMAIQQIETENKVQTLNTTKLV